MSTPGEGITIRDNRGICSHAGFCTDGCPAVWRTGTEPWIDPNGADVDQITETIRKCPSGALSYEIGGEVYTDFDRAPAIGIAKDGPILVQGGIELEGEARADGASLEHYTLCRCGGSKNKPFCDSTHWYIDFKDDEAATRQDKAPTVDTELTWYRVAALDALPEGRVTTVMAGTHPVALTHVGDEYGALCNSCPHQGGPLGEGTLENGILRCPWHGWDFDPINGEAKDAHADHVSTYRVDVREDGIYVGIEEAI